LRYFLSSHSSKNLAISKLQVSGMSHIPHVSASTVQLSNKE